MSSQFGPRGMPDGMSILTAGTYFLEMENLGHPIPIVSLHLCVKVVAQVILHYWGSFLSLRGTSAHRLSVFLSFFISVFS